VEVMALIKYGSMSCCKNEWSVFRAMNQHLILNEMKTKCKWHLCSALQGFWGQAMKKSNVP
jgi:hypothetical protein